MNNRGHQRSTGFTATELMIVVTIIGILLAISVPGYLHYARRSARVQAINTLLRAANWLEQQHTVNHSYASSNTVADLPKELRQSPETGAAKYRLEAIRSMTTYTLRAIPVEGDACGTYTLNQSGRRGTEGATMSECWHGS